MGCSLARSPPSSLGPARCWDRGSGCRTRTARASGSCWMPAHQAAACTLVEGPLLAPGLQESHVWLQDVYLLCFGVEFEDLGGIRGKFSPVNPVLSLFPQ